MLTKGVFHKQHHSFKSEMVMKPFKHQRSKQRWQGLCWKVHDRAQSFVCAQTLRNQNVSIASTSVRCEQLLCFEHGQGQKKEKTIQQRNLSGVHNHSLSINYDNTNK